jgi:hypothetical protein
LLNLVEFAKPRSFWIWNLVIHISLTIYRRIRLIYYKSGKKLLRFGLRWIKLMLLHSKFTSIRLLKKS